MKERIRILYIIHDLSRGGAQAVVYQLIKFLPKETYQNFILYIDKPETMIDDFKDIGAEIIFFSNRFLKQNFFPFRRVIKSINPDIVHSHIPAGLFLIFLFLKLCGVNKIIATYHSTEFTTNIIRRFKEFLVQFLIKYYIHVSKYSEIKHTKHFFIFRNIKQVIYNGVDFNNIKQKIDTIKEKNIFNGGFHVIGVANFHVQKGYKYGLPAMKTLIEKYNDIYYHIVGAAHNTGEIENFIINFIRDNKLTSKILLHGQVENVLPFLCSADIFLSPSEKELLPVSVLEAMACGLPIVATRVGGVPEILGYNNEYGILINPRRCEEIVSAVEKFYLDKNLCKLYSEKSRNRIKYFDVSNTLAGYKTNYEKLLQ